MRHVTVADVMTTSVITVLVTTPFKEVARLLRDHGISALPVLDDDDELVGLVSEADLLLKHEYRDRRRRGSWLSTPHLHEVMVKVEGAVAGDLMTGPPITVEAEASVNMAARLMTERHVKRLPVVDDAGVLVGIVSRADLLSVFLRPDREIKEEIIAEVFRRVLLTERGAVRVEVTNGVVVLDGELDRKSSVDIAVRLTQQVDGVVDVVDHLTYVFDDSESRVGRVLRSM
ncbi:CBS domain-containing protein [Phytoactinopolyspora limicola]|uniref:CBS domain-containing protein n=1 Tax=Phytoactinopolyspora limicola TaxID=2715536 RepID=UPI00140C4430|nr:CBS domain-containing protein [Phytoactinopolyspora limicola]